LCVGRGSPSLQAATVSPVCWHSSIEDGHSNILIQGLKQGRLNLYTDDTGWRIHGESAHLMAFDTDEATVFQILPTNHFPAAYILSRSRIRLQLA
jgi:hypothetical protein